MLPFRPSAIARRQNTCEHSHSPRRLTSDEARPLVVGQFEERHDRLDAGVVDQDVDGTELVPDPIDHGFDFGAVRDVRLDRHGAAAFAADPCGDILGGLSAGDVVDGYVGALLREDLGDALADPAAGAR